MKVNRYSPTPQPTLCCTVLRRVRSAYNGGLQRVAYIAAPEATLVTDENCQRWGSQSDDFGHHSTGPGV
jgi:hypothetical protein